MLSLLHVREAEPLVHSISDVVDRQRFRRTGVSRVHSPGEVKVVGDCEQPPLLVFDEIPADCNENEVIDMREILDDPATDLDRDGVLDECEFLFGDGFESGDTSAWSQTVEVRDPA